ncbi:hypothetical protein FACS1894216_13490 [Synergistales bacterium]|nr:hypothetical protein FACS1894216_13490 [Synergistales bacterium]
MEEIQYENDDSLVINQHNLNILLEYIDEYDDYDIYRKLTDFWDVMTDLQKGKYVKSSLGIFGEPDFLLYIDGVSDAFSFEILLRYMGAWSGGGDIYVLEKLAYCHW